MLKCNSNVNEHERSRSRNGNGHIKRQRFAPASAPFIPFFVSSPPPPDFRPRPTGCGCKTRTHSGPQKDSHPHPQWQPQPHNHEPIQPYIQRQDISRESKKLAKRRMCADESQTNLSHARIWQPRVPTSSPLPHPYRWAPCSAFPLFPNSAQSRFAFFVVSQKPIALSSSSSCAIDTLAQKSSQEFALCTVICAFACHFQISTIHLRQ